MLSQVGEVFLQSFFVAKIHTFPRKLFDIDTCQIVARNLLRIFLLKLTEGF